MSFSSRKYYLIGLFNLVIVALLGSVMRYKIGFDFPYLNQKYILHSHSHFAFAGWVTHVLFVMLTDYLQNKKLPVSHARYMIWVNLLCAYGMLVSFMIQGYGAVSITFSTLSIFGGYYYAFHFWKSVRNQIPKDPQVKWFLAGLFFQTLSSIGTFYLAYMMASHQFNQTLYLGSVYFYLHFQYSGWFFFAIMGLWVTAVSKNPGYRDDPRIFTAFVTACIPAFLLSVLWIELPWYVYWLPLVSVTLQLTGLYRLFIQVKSQYNYLVENWSLLTRILWAAAFFALVIKLLLQAGSVIPEISKLAFGFRSIVIAYLHLVLLAFTTLFLIGYGHVQGWLKETNATKASILLFCVGVFTNELFLMIQGMAGFVYIVVPYLNETLLAVSLVMFVSLFCFLLLQKMVKSNTL